MTPLVVAALECLPVLEPRRKNVAHCAEEILDAAFLGLLEEIESRAQRCVGSERAAKNLVKLQKILASAVALIGTLGPEATLALQSALTSRGDQRSPSDLLDSTFPAIRSAVASALSELRRQSPSRPQTGRNKKLLASKVAQVSAQVFAELTGSAPTITVDAKNVARGPFVQMLGKIYDELGIVASTESRAKDAVALFKGKNDLRAAR